MGVWDWVAKTNLFSCVLPNTTQSSTHYSDGRQTVPGFTPENRPAGGVNFNCRQRPRLIVATQLGLHLEDAEADVGGGEGGSEIVSAIESEGGHGMKRLPSPNGAKCESPGQHPDYQILEKFSSPERAPFHVTPLGLRMVRALNRWAPTGITQLADP